MINTAITKANIVKNSKFEKIFLELLQNYTLEKYIKLINIFETMNSFTKKYYCDIICNKEYENKFYWVLYKFINHVKLNINTSHYNSLYIYYLFQIVYRGCYSETENYVEDITLEFILFKLDGFIKRDKLSEYLLDIFDNYKNNIETNIDMYNTIDIVIYTIYIPLLSLFNINDNTLYYAIVTNILYNSFVKKENDNILLLEKYALEYYIINDFDNLYKIDHISSIEDMNEYLKTLIGVINNKYYILLNKINIYYSLKETNKHSIYIIKYYNFINSVNSFYIKILKTLPEFINIFNICIYNIYNKIVEYDKISYINIYDISEIFN